MTDPFQAFVAHTRGVHGPLAASADARVWAPPPGTVYLLGLAEQGAALLSARCDLVGAPDGALAVAADVQQVADAAAAAAWGFAPAIVQSRWGERRPAWSFDAILPAASDIGAVRDLSYGLALYLAACSRASGLPLPCTSLFSAKVAPDGRLEGVLGVDTKARFVRDALPGVRELWVAECDVDTAREALAGRDPGVVRGACHVEDVVEQVLGKDAVQRAVSALSANERRALIQWMWRDVVCRHRSLPQWAAMFRTVEALHALPGSETDPQLSHLLAVVARHMGQVTHDRLPEAAALALTPRPLRLGLLAQALQHEADGGGFEGRDPLPIAIAAVAAPTERHAEDFALLGALARAHMVRGALQDAVKAARAAVDGWCDVLERPAEAGRPLCMWFHALGVQADESALEHLLQGRAKAVRSAVVEAEDWVGAAFLQLASGVAGLRVWEAGQALGRARGLPDVDGLQRLWAVAGSPAFPPHVWLSAGRHLARFRRAQGRADEAAAIVEELITSTRGHSFHSVFGRLAKLDAALSEEGRDADRIGTELETLSSLDTLAGRLVGQQADAGVVAAARHLALTYPY